MSPVLYHSIPLADDRQIVIASLNNAAKLNSLQQEAILSLQSHLEEWTQDDSIVAIILRGEGERAFCAGGDLHQAYQLMSHGEICSLQRYFASEYQLDETLHQYPKPIICWANGITMGGGMGLMQGCQHRIATEQTVLAMPEITIGLYPDCAAAHFLYQKDESIGLFLSYTGARMNAADARYLELADHVLSSDRFDSLIEALTALPWSDHPAEHPSQITELLTDLESSHCPTLEPSQVKNHLGEIHRLCSHPLPEDFSHAISQLNSDSPWLRQSREQFLNGSPTSAKVIYEHRQRCLGLSISEILALDTIVTQAICARHEFREGIRALLIDKDKSPRWHPATLSEVSEDDIDAHFLPPAITGS